MPVVKNIVKPVKRVLSIPDFYKKHNRVLIIRGVGGLGDILMHRMLFEDFKLLAPDVKIDFACPWQYHDVVKDHPFIDRILGLNEYHLEDYIVSYNTTTACGRYEMKIAPQSDLHRSDIWAKHCGINLTRHNMHFCLTEEEKVEGKQIIEKYRFCDGPAVIFCPISAMDKKNIQDKQMVDIAKGIQERGFYPVALHSTPIIPLIKNNIPIITKPKLRQWLGVINQCDYVVTVDTACLHCAGGMGKPMVGIFTFVNGKTYTKYYQNSECVQSLCPMGYIGCYNWGTCPGIKEPILPCRAAINVNDILTTFELIVNRFT